MNTETATTTTTFARAVAESARYRRYARTTDRLRDLSGGRIKTYRGSYAHSWHSLANAVQRRHGLTPTRTTNPIGPVSA